MRKNKDFKSIRHHTNYHASFAYARKLPTPPFRRYAWFVFIPDVGKIYCRNRTVQPSVHILRAKPINSRRSCGSTYGSKCPLLIFHGSQTVSFVRISEHFSRFTHPLLHLRLPVGLHSPSPRNRTRLSLHLSDSWEESPQLELLLPKLVLVSSSREVAPSYHQTVSRRSRVLVLFFCGGQYQVHGLQLPCLFGAYTHF